MRRTTNLMNNGAIISIAGAKVRGFPETKGCFAQEIAIPYGFLTYIKTVS